MGETEAVSKEVSMSVGLETKCGPDPPKPECNGTNDHSHGNDLDTSYVFVSGADAVDSVSEVSNATVLSGKIMTDLHLHIEEVNGNAECANGYTVEGLTGKTGSTAEAKVADGDGEGFDEIGKSGPALQTEGLDLVAGWGESGGSDNISPHVDFSGYANGEYGKQAETMEAEDVVVGVVECESQHVSIGFAPDEVKLGGEVVETNGASSLTASLNVDLESIPIISEQEANKVQEVVNVIVKTKDEVNISGKVVENGRHEDYLSNSLDLDLESKTINSKEETNMVEDVKDVVKLLEEVIKSGDHEFPHSTSSDVDLESDITINNKEETDVVEGVVECKSQDVNTKVEQEVKSGEMVENQETEVPKSISLDLNLDMESGPIIAKEEADSLDFYMESHPINAKEETRVVEDVADCELQDASVQEGDETKLSREVVETANIEIPPSTSFDVVLESNPIYSKEDIYVIEDVVDCELQVMSAKADDEVRSLGEVLKAAEHEVPPSPSLDLELDSNPTITKEETYVVECELQDVNLEAKDDAILLREVVETSEHEIPPSTVLDVDLESKSINSQEKKEAVEDVVERELQDVCKKVHTEHVVNLSGEVVETADHEIPPSASLDLESITINRKEEINVAENDVGHDIYDVSLTAKDEVNLSGDVVETAAHEIPMSTSPELDMESRRIDMKEDTDVAMEVVECESQDLSVKAEDEVKLLEEVIKTAEREVPSSNSFGLDLESKPINTEKGTIAVVNDVDCESQDAAFVAKGEVNLSAEVVEIGEREVLSSTSLDFNFESNPTSTKKDMGVGTKVVECDLQDVSVKTVDEVKLSGKVEIEEQEVPSSISDSPYANKEGAANIELETGDVEGMAGQVDGARGISNDNLPLGENVETGISQDNNTPVVPPKVSSLNMTDEEEASNKTIRRPFNFLIKVPRFDDESLREQIRLAKLNVDEKTKLRDAIQIQIQEKRASTQIHGIDYEYAKSESRNARKLVRSKRIEIDSLQSVINKAKNAVSIDDINNQIYNMERMIQHETLLLKEEKQLIREIKQLKQLREQLSSNMGSQEEIKQALEQRGEVEGRLKILRKELDVLKGKVLKAEAAAVEAEKKYDDEINKVKEIQAHFRAAADVRQTAYVQWQSLRKEHSKKNEYFFKYKDDASVARNYVYSNDTDALYRFCMNNVENFMVQWNTNDEFRRDYAKFSARNTVWRLGTLDGRALGPDELPPVLPSYVDARVNRIAPTPVKVDLASQFPTLELKQERTTESVPADVRSMKKVTEEKIQRVTNKGPAISEQVNGLDTVSGEDITHEEPKKSREEIEAILKAEEMERKEAESKLKEERRLEALTKASEARERKKKQAEKLQMRAELKTLKEAEQKEKEREKRLRKKERKKTAASDVSDTNCEIGSHFESTMETTTKEVEVKDVSSSTNKKPKKHWLFGKQGKTKSSIPPPLRNRNKKKLQQWMWVGITSLAIFVTFWLGNIGVFPNVNVKQRSTVMT